MSPLAIGIAGLILMVLLLATGMPIAFVFMLVAVLGAVSLRGIDVTYAILGSVPYVWSARYILACIPLFMLMGIFAFWSGISSELYDLMHKWLGRLPGGLAVATVGACGAFACVSGSSLATAVTMGKVALPEMKKHNYSDSLATGTVAAAGTLGALIPPSFAFILYAFITEQSIGKLFMAGIFPGILEVLTYATIIVLFVKLKPTMAQRARISFTMKEKLVAVRGLWGWLVLFGLVIGGIYGGIFTPSEAAAIGALGSFLLVLVRRKMTKATFFGSLNETVRTSAMLFIIIIGAIMLNPFLCYSGISSAFANFMTNLPLNNYGILAVILLMYIILGMFLDALAMMLLTMPIVFPIIVSLGFNPIWFGVIFVRIGEIAVITPPIGMNVYVIKGVAKDVPLETIFRGIFPFFIADLINLAILVAFPQISLFLPSTM